MPCAPVLCQKGLTSEMSWHAVHVKWNLVHFLVCVCSPCTEWPCKIFALLLKGLSLDLSLLLFNQHGSVSWPHHFSHIVNIPLVLVSTELFSFISEHLTGRERGCLRSLYKTWKNLSKQTLHMQNITGSWSVALFLFTSLKPGVEVRLAGPYLHGLLTIHVILDDIKDCDGEEVIIHPRPIEVYIRVGRSKATRVGLKFSWSQKLTWQRIISHLMGSLESPILRGQQTVNLESPIIRERLLNIKSIPPSYGGSLNREHVLWIVFLNPSSLLTGKQAQGKEPAQPTQSSFLRKSLLGRAQLLFSFISEHLTGRERGCLRSLYKTWKNLSKQTLHMQNITGSWSVALFLFTSWKPGVEVRLAGPYLHGLLTIHVILDDINDCDGEEVIIHPSFSGFTALS